MDFLCRPYIRTLYSLQLCWRPYVYWYTCTGSPDLLGLQNDSDTSNGLPVTIVRSGKQPHKACLPETQNNNIDPFTATKPRGVHQQRQSLLLAHDSLATDCNSGQTRATTTVCTHLVHRYTSLQFDTNQLACATPLERPGLQHHDLRKIQLRLDQTLHIAFHSLNS